MAVVLVVIETLEPATSLAQVANAQASQTRYTVVDTRFLTDGRQFKVIACRDGSRWSVHSTAIRAPKDPKAGDFTSATVMDGDRTVSVWHDFYSGDLAETDAPSVARTSNSFDLHRILRNGGSTRHERLDWHGRTVDQFEVHMTYRDRGKTETLDQTVIADAKSHLPLRVEEFRANRSWGDTWDYEYSHPDEAMFHVNLSPTTKVFDLKKERAELQSKLVHGAVFVNAGRVADILYPASNGAHFPSMPVTFPGSSERLSASLAIRPGLGLIRPNRYQINGTQWELATLRFDPNSKLFTRDRVSFEIGNRQLTDVPVITLPESSNLLRPFLKG